MEEHFHQLLLHGRQLEVLASSVIEHSIHIAQSTILQHASHLYDLLSTAIETESRPQQRHGPQDCCQPLVGQAEDGRLGTAGIGSELPPPGIDGNRCLTAQLGYLQVTVKPLNGVLRDDVALLLGQCRR